MLSGLLIERLKFICALDFTYEKLKTKYAQFLVKQNNLKTKLMNIGWPSLNSVNESQKRYFLRLYCAHSSNVKTEEQLSKQFSYI